MVLQIKKKGLENPDAENKFKVRYPKVNKNLGTGAIGEVKVTVIEMASNLPDHELGHHLEVVSLYGCDLCHRNQHRFGGWKLCGDGRELQCRQSAL